MNQAQVAFVKWVQQVHPTVYRAAVSRVARKNSLGGLGDDLTSDIVFDPGTVNVSASTTAALNAATSDISGNSWSDIINSLAGAITTVAPQIVQTKAQLSTIQINAQRAANGQRPITSTSLFTGQGLTSNSGLMIGLAVLIGGGLLLASGKKSR